MKDITKVREFLSHQNSASDYGDFTRIMALYKLYYLLT